MRTIILFAIMFVNSITIAGRASFSVLVVDNQTGEPVPGVKIEGSFLNFPKGWNESAKDNDVDAMTKQNGIAELSGNTEKGIGGYRIYSNPGYYNKEWTQIKFSERSVLRLGRWLPTDIVSTARLDRVINPVPLYVKTARKKYREANVRNYTVWKKHQGLSATNNVPVIKDISFSFDMIKGEWLPPHGNGEYEDIRFTFNETVLGWIKGRGYDGTYMTKKYRVDVVVVMPGEGNGVVEMPSSEGVGIKIRTVPSNGYSNNILRWKGWFGGGDGIKTDCDKNRNYAFRIRTKYDASGNIESAYYGKIYGDFNIKDLEGVEFLYYLNPTSNDRNLEWDMKNNLCPTQERIHNPQP